MNKYTIHCTAEQTRKALELGAQIAYANIIEIRQKRCVCIGKELYAFPTAEQMIGWLRSQGIKFLLSDEPDEDGDYWFVGINKEKQTSGADKENKELAAIDAALEYLTNNKK